MLRGKFKRNRGVYKCHTFGTLQMNPLPDKMINVHII